MSNSQQRTPKKNIQKSRQDEGRLLAKGTYATHAGMVRAERLKIPGDGNCLFAAVAQGIALRQHGRFHENPAVISQKANLLRQAVRKLQCVDPAGVVRFNGLFDDAHCDKIGRPGEYGGEPEILALAIITRRPIALFDATPETPISSIYVRHSPYRLYTHSESTQPPLYLLYSPGRPPNHERDAHYDLLYHATPIVERQLPQVETATERPVNQPPVANRRPNNNNNTRARQQQQQPVVPQIQIVPIQTPPAPGGGSSFLPTLGGFGGGEELAAIATVALSCVCSVVRMVSR